MSVFPKKRDSVLIVDSDTETIRQLALQSLQSVARWHREVFELRGHIQHLQLAPHNGPQFARNTPGGSRVPFTKEVGSRLITEGLNHSVSITYYTSNV